MAVTVEIVSFSLMVVCCLLWVLLFHRNMLVAVRVRLWPGNIGRWEVLNLLCAEIELGRLVMGIQVTVTGGTEVNDRILELLDRKWRLDQMTFTVLSFCRHLLSLSSKEHLGYCSCSVCRKGKSQRVYLKNWLPGMAV